VKKPKTKEEKNEIQKECISFSGNVKCKISRVEPAGERLSVRGGPAWVVNFWRVSH